jgi:hypothetical protein
MLEQPQGGGQSRIVCDPEFDPTPSHADGCARPLQQIGNLRGLEPGQSIQDKSQDLSPPALGQPRKVLLDRRRQPFIRGEVPALAQGATSGKVSHRPQALLQGPDPLHERRASQNQSGRGALKRTEGLLVAPAFDIGAIVRGTSDEGCQSFDFQFLISEDQDEN